MNEIVLTVRWAFFTALACFCIAWAVLSFCVAIRAARGRSSKELVYAERNAALWAMAGALMSLVAVAK